MINDIRAIAATSPQDLADQLRNPSKEDEGKRYVTLAISGPQVLVQPFTIEEMKVKDIKNRLQVVSVELLNLPLNQITFDYQILNSQNNKTSGVFTCIPQSLVGEYIKEIKKAGLIPIRITAYILASLNSFYLQNKAYDERFCLLDFSREGYINLVVINNQRFELLRKVTYDNLEEALFEIKQSLRSACAKSTVKTFDHIYLSGDVPQRDKVTEEIEKDFDTKTIYKDSHCVKKALNSEKNFFSINIIRNTCFSVTQRKKILLATHIFLVLCIVGCYFLGVKVHKNDKLIKKLNLQQSKLDYNYVKGEEFILNAEVM